VLFGKFRILGKLTLLILVPLLGVVALTVPIIVDRINAARDAQDTSDVVRLATQVGTALQEMQAERLLSVGYFLGLVQQPELAVQTAKAQDDLNALTRLDPPIPTGLRQAIANAGAILVDTRATILNRSIRPDRIVSDFTNAITPIIGNIGLAKEADLTTGTGRQVFALDQALRSDDLISQISGYLAEAVATKQPGFIGLFSTAFIQIQQLIVNAQPFFTPVQYQLYTGAQEAFTARVGPAFFTAAATDPNKAVASLNLQTLFPSLRSVAVLGGFVEKRIASDVTVAVTDNRDSALRTASLIGGGALLLLLIVVALSIFMARAVARPLRRLTASADRIARAAETELQRVADDEEESVRPIRLDPVDVQARDEIGDLARAFDRIQITAVRLVERQVFGRRNVAQMFGHVGRRTQNLVGRQLALIDNLERRETDSDRLRELYRLDHMSSRLRRNAGSLVVLSGGAGTNEHMAPLSLSDVVRLALGEIEDYTRVDVDVPEDIVIVPAVAADLTLLLAELMENATSFSPPHTRVAVTANALRGGARLAVVDQGLGLTPERLAEENARLARRERLDLAPTEVLGLFVVGRLARRHGIEVTLTDTPQGGVTAWVDLRPQHLVGRAEPMPLGAPAPIHATVGHPTEFAPLLAGSSVRSAPGSAQPFDANVLDRATRTLQSARSWNAFIPMRPVPPELEAAPSGYADSAYPQSAPPYPQSAPPYPQNAPAHPQSAPAARWEAPARPEPQSDYREFEQRVYDAGTPVAGRAPAAMPELPVAHPTSGGYADTEPPVIMEGPIVMSTPPGAIQLPRQRTGEPESFRRNGDGQRPVSPAPLRRRVPGTQLPAETGMKLPSAPPSTDDALAAREAFEAFEAGVSRAQWDVIEADMASPPAAGHEPLTRRVPGATLPVDQPPMNPNPPANPASPLDPDAARALVEQFEYGVALALNETQPQHEGQPR
jgi:signal transduction histidine kinase